MRAWWFLYRHLLLKWEIGGLFDESVSWNTGNCYLDCFNVNIIFSDFNTLGLSLFFLLVYNNLSNFCYYLFSSQSEDNPDFKYIHRMYLHSFQKVMGGNFSTATISFLFSLPLYRGPVCHCCTMRKCAFPSKFPGQFSFCNDNKSQKSCLIS